MPFVLRCAGACEDALASYKRVMVHTEECSASKCMMGFEDSREHLGAYIPRMIEVNTAIL